MAIAVTQRGASNVGTDTSSMTMTIGSVALTNGLFYIAFVCTGSAGTGPSVVSIAGTGLSMTKKTTTGDAETLGTRRMEVWYGLCTASGTVTVTCTITPIDSNCQDWAIYEVSGADATGTNGVNAIVQAVCDSQTANTAMSFTGYAAFGSSDNRPLVCCVHAANEPTTHESGAGYSELTDGAHNNPVSGFCTQWHSSSADTDPDFTWSSSAGAIAIGVELKIAVAATQSPRSMHNRRLSSEG